MYWGGIITIPFWFLAPNNPFSWKTSIWYPFCSHTTKRKVQAQPWLSFWRYRQTPISIQTRKAHTLWHEHSLTYIWWIYSSKLAIFQNSSSKKQTLLFPICLVKLLFHFTFFRLCRCKNTIFLATNNRQTEITSILESLRCELASLVLKSWIISPILVQKYILRAFYCYIWYDLKHYFLFSSPSEQNIHNKITPNAKLPMAYRTVSIKYATEWTMNIRTPHAMLYSVHLQAGWHYKPCSESCLCRMTC